LSLIFRRPSTTAVSLGTTASEVCEWACFCFFNNRAKKSGSFRKCSRTKTALVQRTAELVLNGLIALEHNLGLTADPVARLVQMPCIIAMLWFLGRRRTLRTRRRVGCYPLRIRQIPASAQRLVELNNDKPPADLSLVKRLLG